MKELSENAKNPKSKKYQEYDERGNLIYEKDGNLWMKKKYDENNNEIFSEFSSGSWYKKEYTKDNRILKREGSDGRSLEYDYDKDGSYYLKDHNGEITHVPVRIETTDDLLEKVGASIRLLDMAIFARVLQIKMPHMNFSGKKMKYACEKAYYQEYTPELKYWSDLTTANLPPTPEELILLIKHYVSSEGYESASYFQTMYKKMYPGLKLEL